MASADIVSEDKWGRLLQNLCPVC